MTYSQQTWADGEAGGTPITAATLDHMEAGIAAAQLALTLDDDVALYVAQPLSDTGAAVLSVANTAAAAAVAGLSIPADADDLADGGTHVMMTSAERVNLSDVKALVDAATSAATNSAIVKRSVTGSIAVSGITGLSAPTANDQAATKLYVDTAVSGVSVSSETIQDAVGAMIVGGTGITATYDDVAGEVNLDVTDSGPVSVANLPAGAVLYALKAGTWPSRPTSRTDVRVIWIGAATAPTVVASGTGGALANDLWVPIP